jgi:transcriptional regulator with GAF, ATPase, and Fis domain
LGLDDIRLVQDAVERPAVVGREAREKSLHEIQREHILWVLDDCGWKVRGKDGAAERLGLKRTTLNSRMKRLGIERPRA